MTYYLFDPNFSYRRILDLPQNNSVQNLSHLILKSSELQVVGEKHPCNTLAKKSSMSRVKLAMQVRPTAGAAEGVQDWSDHLKMNLNIRRFPRWLAQR